MPTGEIVGLAKPHGVPVYPCVSASGMTRRKPFGKGSLYGIEAWRAVGATTLRSGASGISLFNLFPAPGDDAQNRLARAVFSEVGDRATLKGKDKLFCLDNAEHLDRCGYINHVVPYSQCLPKPLAVGQPTTLLLPVGEDASVARSVELRVQTDALAKLDVRLNGRPVPLAPSEGLRDEIGMFWQVGPVRGDELRPSENTLEATLRGQPTGPVRLVGAELMVRYA
jgi:hypothetical protein